MVTLIGNRSFCVCRFSKRTMKNLSALVLTLASIALISSCGDAVSSPPAPPSLGISPSTAPSGTVGFAYSLALSASGGQAPYAWSVSAGTLPGGLSLNASTGMLSGVPAASGSSNFTVQATDSSVPVRTGSMPLTVIVNAQLAFSISSLPDAAVSVPYNTTASVSGGAAPYTWSIVSGSLPPGLSLNSATGAITGTPTTAGGYGLGLKVTDSSNPQQTAKFFSGINVYAQLVITSTSLPDGNVGSSYSATLTATGGTGSYSWSISSGNLPDGISLDPGTGVLSGTPTSEGQASFTVQVTDTANPPQDPALPLTLNVGPQGANDKLLKGSYAFLFQGVDSHGAVAFAGTLNADGAGSITGGVLDINRSSGAQENVAVEAGQFAIGSDNRGTLTIRSTLGSQTFSIAVNVDGTLVHFIEFDAAAANAIRGNGIMKKRADSSAQFDWDGNYAFSFAGSTSTGWPSAMLGSFAATPDGQISAGLADANSNGATEQEASIQRTSSYNFSANGRGTLKLVVDRIGSISGAAYFVSANESFFVRTDAPRRDLLSGEIRQQSGAPFLAPAFAGTGVLHVEGESLARSTNVGVGLVSANGLFALSGSYSANEGSGLISTPVAEGSYTITSSDFGRGTMNFAGNDFTFYVVDSASTFVMGASGTDVKSGLLESQPGAGSVAYEPVGKFAAGTESGSSASNEFESGIVGISPNGSFAGTVDLIQPGSLLSSGDAINGSFVTAAEGNVEMPRGTILYVISPLRIIEVDSQAGQASPKVLILDR